jgi:hypothetical protein
LTRKIHLNSLVTQTRRNENSKRGKLKDLKNNYKQKELRNRLVFSGTFLLY